MSEKICPTCGTEYPANERFCPRDGTALRSTGESTDLVGSIIAERYHVMKKLGEGGMGQVYLAEHVKMGRKSAVKVMNPGMVNDADAISRFNREAANASMINHPNVAGIYDFGETSDGLIYLAMEFIEGESLTAIVEREGALTPKRAANIIKQTADGLQVAHDMGIVHRDLKPDNIMIAKKRDGTDLVKVVDFGIAKAAGNENQKVTKTGLVVGTPEYMSPEQLSGDKLDGKSDIYSLALVAFNVLTGKLPFPAESAQESMIMRLTDDPATLKSIKPDVNWSPEVQAVMKKALERKRDDRYQKASYFGDALWNALDQMPKQSSAASTAMFNAADGATTVMAPPPPTRVDARASSATPAPVTPASAAPFVSGPVAAPAKSKAPMYAGIVVALGLAAGAVVYAPKMMNKNGATPDTSKSATPITAPPQAATQNGGAAPSPSGPSGSTQQVNHPVGAQTTRPLPAVPTPQTPGTSLVGDLELLYNSVLDNKTADAAQSKVDDYQNKVSRPDERATLKMVDGKIQMITVGQEKACRIFKKINAADLSPTLRQELNDAGCQ